MVVRGLFEMSEKDLRILDELEGSQGYIRENVTVDLGDKKLFATIFISPDTKEGEPGEKYVSVMEAGKKDCNIL